MKKRKLYKFILFLLGGILGNALSTSAQLYSVYDVVPVNGKYFFSYNQTPDNLVPIVALATGSAYLWESTTNPETIPFATAPGPAGNASYSFSQPLATTTYFRRRTTVMTGTPPVPIIYYSNVIKIEIVSVNWENLNYVREHSVLVPGITSWTAVDQLQIGEKLQTTTYMDGMGRSIQTVSRETATPNPAQPNLWGDQVQFVTYDAFGRQTQNYAPYSSSTASGKYKSSSVSEQSQYYTTLFNETHAYEEASYDNSPLNRVVNTKSLGTAWAAGQGRSISYDLNDDLENVRKFKIGYNTGDYPASTDKYSINTLFKTKYIDDNGKQVIEHRDSDGKLILKKIQIDDNPSLAHAGWICTYSIYDDFDRLRYVIQPEGVKWLDANNWSFSGTGGQKIADEYCFRYEYDNKGKMVLKKAPGAKELYMLYDQRDRLVFTQDGNQRGQSPGEWTVNFYDELDRNVITAIYKTSKTVAALKTDIDNAATVSTVAFPGTVVTNLVVESRNIGIASYIATSSIEFTTGFESGTNDQFETSINPNAIPGTTESYTIYNNPVSPADITDPDKFTVLKYNYYDNYIFPEAKSFDNGFTNAQAYAASPVVDPISKSNRVTSMVTGAKVRVLGSSVFLSTTILYDEKGRAIQKIEDNIKSGIDITTNQYHFDNRLLSSHVKHTASGTLYSGYNLLSRYNYDRIGRVVSVQKKYGDNDFKTIFENEYDDAGRLKKKRLAPGYTETGKMELESFDYSYNIHNEITGINKDYALKTPGKYNKWGNFFGLYLGYDNRDGVFASQQLDGHVTGALWTTQGDDAQRKYDFSYDNAGRLVNAVYNERQTAGDPWSNAKMNFSVSGSNGKITYDLNSNLLSLLQKGVMPGSSAPVNIDDLQYSYSSLSNKLVKVLDNSTAGLANGKMNDFFYGSNGSADDYVYDDNGNLVIDLNKSIKDMPGLTGGRGIKYNHLDKPEEIYISGKGTIRIIYDANGNKLQKQFTPQGSTTAIVTSYIKSFVYKADELQFIYFEEGRIRVTQPVTQNNGYDQLTINGNMDLPGGKRGAYDYFVRDYQGNVRMILTEETHAGSNACTMETQRAANEETLFGQVDANGAPTSANEVRARFPVSSIPGQSSGSGWQNSSIGSYVSRIGNLAGNKIGPNALLKVMAGDKVSATTQYYYQSPVVNTNDGNALLTSILLSLTQAISGSSVTDVLTKNAAGNITSQLNGVTALGNIANPDGTNNAGNIPKAYLTILFFDERFRFVEEGSVSVRVAQSGNGAAPLILTDIKAPKNGFAYVYVSNQSNEMVYFDNVQVSNNRGRIIEENHYYAFGLKISALSSQKLADINEGHVINKDLYNEKELIDDADIDWYDYGFRNYDPQIGRFVQLDPLTDHFPALTPYQYASNDPITNIDIDGLEGAPATWTEDVFHNTLEAVGVTHVIKKTVTASSYLSNASSFLNTTRLVLIAGRGSTDALYNANTVGLYDFFGGNHLEDYESLEEQKAYLIGRLAGNTAALVQGATQVKGGSAAALATAGTGVGVAVGGAVALHGVGVGATATSDIVWTLKRLAEIEALLTPPSIKFESTDELSSNSSQPPSGGKRTPRKWELTDEGASRIMNHGVWGRFYKSKSDGFWWAKDKTGHGGSAFKVFVETKKGLEWYADADEYGNFIIGKHKGPTGLSIPWYKLKVVK